MKLGSIMRACRERAGFSQEELAHRLNRDPSGISRLESGKQSPDMNTVMDWAKVTDTVEVFVAYMYGAEALNTICKINEVGA